jgi:hypothetical protein
MVYGASRMLAIYWDEVTLSLNFGQGEGANHNKQKPAITHYYTLLFAIGDRRLTAKILPN